MKDLNEHKLRDTAMDNAGNIGLAMLFLVAIVGSIVVIEINKDGVVNWANLIYNTLLGLVAFVCARRQGVIKGDKTPAHVENRRIYGAKITALVDSGGIDQMEEFCRERTKKREQEIRENIMIRVCISPQRFAELQKMTDEERNSVLDKKTQKAYRRATGKINVRPVSPKTILADIDSRDNSLDVVSRSKVEDFFDYLAKIVPSVIMPIVIAFVELAGAQGDTMEIVFGITMRLFILVSSAISGIAGGQKKAKSKDHIILNRVLFLALYEDWRKKKNTKDKIVAATSANNLTEKVDDNFVESQTRGHIPQSINPQRALSAVQGTGIDLHQM